MAKGVAGFDTSHEGGPTFLAGDVGALGVNTRQVGFLEGCCRCVLKRGPVFGAG